MLLPPAPTLCLQGLLAALRQRVPLAVRLSGPMGNEVAAGCRLAPPEAWRQYEVVVMVCGGVGVTAMLSMLRSMAAQRAQHAAVGGRGAEVAAGQQGSERAGLLPRRVVCVWTARHMEEFQALDAPMLQAAA
jgi:hypothetical protein